MSGMEKSDRRLRVGNRPSTVGRLPANSGHSGRATLAAVGCESRLNYLLISGRTCRIALVAPITIVDHPGQVQAPACSAPAWRRRRIDSTIRLAACEIVVLAADVALALGPSCDPSARESTSRCH